jgi:PRTRC genetic system ThiF family protein
MVNKKVPYIDLDYANAATLLLPDRQNIGLSLVGCGGTGSWLAPAIVRIAKLSNDRSGKKVAVRFFDPDLVEEKNCYRQNFCPAEIGRNKAETLAERYGLAWGVEVQAFAKKFEFNSSLRNEIEIIIGCVDNWEARARINSYFMRSFDLWDLWWLDCGNSRNSGQVVFGSLFEKNRGSKLPGIVNWLPAPAALHPELIEPPQIGEEESTVDTTLSCAEIALLDSQGLAINQRIAAEAADYLVRALITRDLRKYATYIDLESGSCRSLYIQEEKSK